MFLQELLEFETMSKSKKSGAKDAIKKPAAATQAKGKPKRRDKVRPPYIACILRVCLCRVVGARGWCVGGVHVATTSHYPRRVGCPCQGLAPCARCSTPRRVHSPHTVCILL